MTPSARAHSLSFHTCTCSGSHTVFLHLWLLVFCGQRQSGSETPRAAERARRARQPQADVFLFFSFPSSSSSSSFFFFLPLARRDERRQQAADNVLCGRPGHRRCAQHGQPHRHQRHADARGKEGVLWKQARAAARGEQRKRGGGGEGRAEETRLGRRDERRRRKRKGEKEKSGSKAIAEREKKLVLLVFSFRLRRPPARSSALARTPPPSRLSALLPVSQDAHRGGRVREEDTAESALVPCSLALLLLPRLALRPALTWRRPLACARGCRRGAGGGAPSCAERETTAVGPWRRFPFCAVPPFSLSSFPPSSPSLSLPLSPSLSARAQWALCAIDPRDSCGCSWWLGERKRRPLRETQGVEGALDEEFRRAPSSTAAPACSLTSGRLSSCRLQRWSRRPAARSRRRRRSATATPPSLGAARLALFSRSVCPSCVSPGLPVLSRRRAGGFLEWG